MANDQEVAQRKAENEEVESLSAEIEGEFEMHETNVEDTNQIDQVEVVAEETTEADKSEMTEEEATVEEANGSNGDPEPEEDEEAAAEDGGEEGDEGDDGEEDDDEEEEDEDEEDTVDPADALRETCTRSASCKPLMKSFEACEERVSSKSQTEETCLEEYMSFIKCRDKCVARDLFTKLK